FHHLDRMRDRGVADIVHLELPAARSGILQHLTELLAAARWRHQLAVIIGIVLLAFDEAIALFHRRAFDAAIGRIFESADAQPVVAEIRREEGREIEYILGAEDALQDAHPRRHPALPPELHIGRDLVEREAGLERRGDAEAIELAVEELQA